MKNSSNALPRFSQSRLIRITLFIALATVAIFPLLTASSASLTERPAKSIHVASNPVLPTTPVKTLTHKRALPFASIFQAGTPSIATSDGAACATPDSDFAVNTSVCASASNTGASFSRRRITWVDPQGYIRQSVEATGESQNDTFTIPGVTSLLANGELVKNTGTWRVNITSGRGSIISSASFFVNDQANPEADLSIEQRAADDTVASGFASLYRIVIYNSGPNTASNVVLTNDVPANTTFSSITPSANCTAPASGGSGSITCSIPTLARGSFVSFVATFTVNGGSANRTVISNTATVGSETSELNAKDNSSTSYVSVENSEAASCSLGCPGDITVPANTTENQTSGAIVNFPNAEGVGECGALTTSLPSGSFFPVGTTTVTVSSATGGGSCSFNVRVVENAVSITCPANVEVNTEDCAPANVTPGSPQASPSGVEVTGERSDSLSLEAPYPVGVTTITWKATDDQSQVASCQQTITVSSNDAVNPTIAAPPNVITATGDGSTNCGAIVGETELGRAEANDNCSVNVTRSGVPAGNFFPKGLTTITYTATDLAGNTATATQTIEVVDNTAPIISAPGDANYTCLSEVPAGDPSQATRGEFDQSGNPIPPGPPIDNCSTATVTVSESSTGAGSASNPLVITRTYTATDAEGNSASDSQTITVIDNTAPTVTAPDDASYQCAASVPAANAADATASDNCNPAPAVTVSDSSSGAGSPSSPLVITRTYTATDAAGNSASDSQTITVIDNTAPTVTAPAATNASADASCLVAIPNVVSGTQASDNCAGSVTLTQSPAAGTMVGLGTHNITVTGTDAAGNSSSSGTTFTVNDTTAPTLACPTSPIIVELPANSSATSMAVNFPTITATDNCSTVSVSTSVPSGSVFPVGVTTVNVSATDAAGNTSTCSFDVIVRYNFTGFFSPVANMPTLNAVHAGRAIPVKFSLSGNKGLGIFAADSPVSVGFDCGTATEIDVVETLTAGGSSLSYTTDQYSYVWKTESSWVGTCRQLRITLNDGTVHSANFKFK